MPKPHIRLVPFDPARPHAWRWLCTCPFTADTYGPTPQDAFYWWKHYASIRMRD